MQRVLVIVGVCASVAAVLWFVMAPSSAEPTVPKNDTIVAFGDSLVAGVGATSGNDFVSRTALTIGMPIINMGRAGDTTRTGLSRLDAVLAQDPGVVIVLLGGNDYLQRIPLEETEQNLSEIITRVQEQGAVVVLLGVRGGVLRDNFSSMYERVSERHNTLYVSDVLDGLIGNGQYMDDAIHPNDAGYARIADRLSEVFQTQISWPD